MDLELLGEFGEAITRGDIFPPVVAFDDETCLWLADGYHRWHANKALGITEVDCLVYQGTRVDALRYSLQANAQHGKRPTPDDLRRAYSIAVVHEFVEPWDVDGVVALLRCSDRWARELTQAARAQRDRERDAEIMRLKAEGMSNRQVAKETGVNPSTVDRLQGGAAKRKASEMRQPSPPPPRPVWTPDDIFGSDEAEDSEPVTQLDARPPITRTDPKDEAERLSRLEASIEASSPVGQSWHAVLEAMRAINALKSVESLFSTRYTGFDHALGPESAKAHAWINAFHRRFNQ